MESADADVELDVKSGAVGVSGTKATTGHASGGGGALGFPGVAQAGVAGAGVGSNHHGSSEVVGFTVGVRVGGTLVLVAVETIVAVA